MMKKLALILLTGLAAGGAIIRSIEFWATLGPDPAFIKVVEGSIVPTFLWAVTSFCAWLLLREIKD